MQAFMGVECQTTKNKIMHRSLPERGEGSELLPLIEAIDDSGKEH